MQDTHLSTIRSPTWTDYLRLGSAAGLWGATFLLNEVALERFSPIAIAAYRIMLAALFLNAICYLKALYIPLSVKTTVLLVSIALFNSVIPFSLIGWGQLRIDSATTAILLATSPFFTLLLSHFMTIDDRFAWRRLFGLTFGFLGVTVLFWRGVGEGSASVIGQIAVVLAGGCYAFSSLLIRKLPKMPSLVLAALTLLIGTGVLLPVLILTDPPWQQAVDVRTLTALILLAIGPTAIAYVLRAQIVRINGALFMSNVGYLIPLFAVLWAFIFLKQQPALSSWVALVLILFGVGIGQRAKR